jgi:hypothetical protein
VPNEKGIFWAFELGIGLLILSTLFIAQPTPIPSHAAELAGQLCLDLQEMWMQGEELEAIIQSYFPEKNITISSGAISSTGNNTAMCEATRVRNGTIEKQFIAIEW